MQVEVDRVIQLYKSGGRLPKELARAGISDMGSANRYLEQF